MKKITLICCIIMFGAVLGFNLTFVIKGSNSNLNNNLSYLFKIASASGENDCPNGVLADKTAITEEYQWKDNYKLWRHRDKIECPGSGSTCCYAHDWTEWSDWETPPK